MADITPPETVLNSQIDRLLKAQLEVMPSPGWRSVSCLLTAPLPEAGGLADEGLSLRLWAVIIYTDLNVWL